VQSRLKELYEDATYIQGKARVIKDNGTTLIIWPEDDGFMLHIEVATMEDAIEIVKRAVQEGTEH
jgi:tRNA(Phe) wybutosine-synthesizing methylase Tyw3